MRAVAVAILLALVLAGCSSVEEITAIPEQEPLAAADSMSETPPTVLEESDALEEPTEPITFDSLDTTRFSFWFRRNNSHSQPGLGLKREYLEQYGVIALGPREPKYVYLTFDEGYEQGFTSRILDVLLEEQVPAAFFITGQYLLDCPDLVARMADEGHLIGNHTMRHPSLPDLDETSFIAELLELDELLYQLIGQKTAFMRPPMGHYSEWTLAYARHLGYKTVFWSMAYADWYVNNQPGAQYAYDHVLSNIHPGAVILLHAVSQSNTEALSDIIRALKAQGYEFRTLDDFR